MTRLRILGALLGGLVLMAFAPVAGCASDSGLLTAAPPAPIFAVDAGGLPQPGHFDRRSVITVETRNKSQLEISKDGRQVWAVHNEFKFRTLVGDLITVHAGVSTDLASIPAPARVLLPSDGPYAQGAILHDRCFASKGDFIWHGHIGHTREAPYTFAECNHLFGEAMTSLHVSPWRISLIETALTVANGAGWGT